MRIAQIVPLHIPVPPLKYGGTERVVANLIAGLLELGHDVTLFATGDSETRARLVPMWDRHIFFDPTIDAAAVHMGMLSEIYNDWANEFDVIHSHLDYMTLRFIDLTSVPTVLTLHGRLDSPEFRKVFAYHRNANYVSISDNQRRDMPDLNWVQTVYHGIDVQSFPFVAERGEYLAFVGRMSHEKRPDLAIEVAIRAGIPLKIAAKVDHKEQPYFEERIEPLLKHRLITWMGEVDEEGKKDLLSHALALLMPIDWPEPFGMAFIEALACGTPVITRNCGSVPELLKDGVTGYVADTADELVEAVHKVKRISRYTCRRYAEQRFDKLRMAKDYMRVYDQVQPVRSPARGRTRALYAFAARAALADTAVMPVTADTADSSLPVLAADVVAGEPMESAVVP